QEFGRIPSQYRQAAQPGGDVEEDLVRFLDLRLDGVAQLGIATVGPGQDVDVASTTANAPDPEADLPDQHVSGQSHERDEEDDRQPGQAGGRLALAPDDDRQDDQPDHPSETEEDHGPRWHRLSPGRNLRAPVGSAPRGRPSVP